MISTPASVMLRVVQHLVREARQPERGGDDAEEHHRALVRQPLVDEAVRRVVASALGYRPSFEKAHDRNEGRVEDRHGEHEDRQQEGRDGRAGDRPARCEAERREREPQHLAAAVAHEDRRRAAQAEVVREEAEAGKADAERSVATRWLGWVVNASIAKNAHAMAARVAASPSMLSSRLNAFVIPISQRTPITVAATSLPTISTRTPEASTRAAAAPCAPIFMTGERWKTSSRRPATKRMAQPPRMPPSSAEAGMRPAASAMPAAASRPAMIPLPPRLGVERLCHRSARGAATRWRAAGVCSSARIVRKLAGSAARAATATVTASA